MYIKLTCFLISVACICSILLLFKTNNLIYVSPLFFIISSCFVISLPNLAPSLHKRPLYLNDIAVDDTETVLDDEKERRKLFYKRFKIIINLSFVCLLTAAMDYIVFRLNSAKEGSQSYVEIIGVIGGILSLWNKVQQISGRILLRACYVIQQYKTNTHRENLLNLLKKPPPNNYLLNDNCVYLGV